MTTVACVFRSGGAYRAEHVHALRRGVARHLSGHRFVALSDVPDLDPSGVPLVTGWPGWWAKMELFRPGLFEGPVLYLDLDTIPVGDLSDLAGHGVPFAMLSDFYRPRRAQSGVMLFTTGEATERIWREFSRAPEDHMRRFRGDGEWLHAHTRPERIQALFPGQVVSLKVHARKGPPPGARLVCLHGNPRPHSPEAGWAYRAWTGLAEREEAA